MNIQSARNVGRLDQVVRVIVGVVLIVLPEFFILPAWGAILCYVVGGIALLTGTFRFCPAWKVFHINTCGTPSGKSPLRSDTGRTGAA